MSSALCCGIWRRRGPEDGVGQPTTNTDPRTQSTSPVTPATHQRVRPQSVLSVITSRPSVPVPSTTHGTRNTNDIAQSSFQNNLQQPTIPATGESHIQLDLWGEAIATLSDDERKCINRATGDASTSMPDVVDAMMNLAAERQKQCEKRGWKKFDLNGYEISLSDLASNAIIWLNKFKEIGDIIVQYDPVHAALPWAAARFILQAIITTKEQMAASLTIMENVVRIIHRCQVFEELYNRRTIDHAVAKNLESALIKLYASVLQALVGINKFLSKSTPTRSLHAIIHPTTGSSLLASLENSEAQVEREIVACEGQRKANVDARYQEQLRGLLELREPVLRTDGNVKKVLQKLDKEELIRILQWISPIEYRSHHNTVKELRTKDTCDWLLEHPKFGQWSSATSTITLWLQGFPGAGKTYLTSRIIEGIEAVLVRKGSDESFAFFYCNRNEEDRRNTLAILRSYVRQLSTTPHRLGSIHPQLKQLYIDSQLKGSGWTLELCKDYLIKLFNFYPSITLVLDALDECAPEERTNLLDFFDSIPGKTSKPVRIFISSRPEGDIRQRLVHLSSIEIQATDNEQDISKFVKQSIEKNGRWNETLRANELLKNRIVDTLLDQSKGMFQWAALQINQLLNLRTEPEINSRLGKLPQGLKAAYDEIFERIENLGTPAGIMSLRALRWIMCAYKPLSEEELLAAVRVNPDEKPIEPFKPKKDDLLDWCANLIRIDSQQDPPVWRLSHLSVVEYLETHWTLLEAHCFVAKASLTILQETHQIFYQYYPLLNYVNHNWIRHVQTQEHRDPDLKLAGLLKAFLGSLEISSAQYRRWHLQIESSWERILSFPSGEEIRGKDISPNTATIFLVCYCSFYKLLRDWWDTVPVKLLTHQDDGGNDPFSIAAAVGCKPICIKMYGVGIPVNKPLQTGIYGSVLAAAAVRNNIEIAQFLVDKGADINMPLQAGDYGSALAAASTTGHTEIVQLFVSKGADIDMPLQVGRYGSALAGAAISCNIKTVQFLIDKGANINKLLQVGYYGSALAAAAGSRNNIEIVQFLVEKGADINMPLQVGEYGSALAAAAVRSNIEVVKFLVDKGADINMPLQVGNYGSALAAAISTVMPEIETVRFFVDKGADINMPLRDKDGVETNALAIAEKRGRTKMARILIDNGAILPESMTPWSPRSSLHIGGELYISGSESSEYDYQSKG
ncbi:hypothetical protein GGR58DRAFT_467094 [Xylaria digitata]|nr:hypothetical protein GGR58DRAFT_467094 [Xylaria digitata]